MMPRFSNQITIMYFIVVALFFNTATSMAMVGGDSQSGKGTLLCTLQGYQWVSLEGDDAPISSSFVHCQFCLFPTADDGFDYSISGAQRLSVSDGINVSIIVSTHLLLIKSYSPSSYAQGRAPPLVTV